MLDYTGDTKIATGTAKVYEVRAGSFAGVGALFYDDIVLNDTTGSFFNSWPNGLKIHKVSAPTSSGYYSQWTPVGATINYQCIDETPPTATDYVQGNYGSKDSYSFGDSPASGIKATATRYWGSGVGSLKRVCRYDSTDYLSNVFTIPSTFNKVDDIMYTAPGGITWTKAIFDACEFGMEKQ